MAADDTGRNSGGEIESFDALQDVADNGRSSLSTTEEDQIQRESAIINGRPFRIFFWLDYEIRIYPKPQGYFYKIEEAAQRYINALGRVQRRMFDPWWTRIPLAGWFVRTVRNYRTHMAFDAVEKRKYKLFSLILEDKYFPEFNNDFPKEAFYAMPHDIAVQILAAHRELNDVTDILRELIPGFEDPTNDPKKKAELEELKLETSQSGMRV